MRSSWETTTGLGGISKGAVIAGMGGKSGEGCTAMYTVPSPTNNLLPIKTGKISLREEFKTLQIRLINSALDNNNGNWAVTRDLDMNRCNLYNLATRLGVQKKTRTCRH